MSRISNMVSYAGSTNVAATTTTVTQTDLQTLVLGALSKGKFPADANALYIIFPSQDLIDNQGSCTQYCGYHTYSTYQNIRVKWSFITNPASPPCTVGCYSINRNSANDNAAGDAMVSVLAHEITEAITDPDFSGWYDSDGEENADKCAWTYGTMIMGDNGYYNANIKVGQKKFLVQQIWLYVGKGSCVKGYPYLNI